MGVVAAGGVKPKAGVGASAACSNIRVKLRRWIDLVLLRLTEPMITDAVRKG
jgi:hypothetical protein